MLPVEFSRISEDGRITLAIDALARDVPVLWTDLRVQSQAEAVNVLAAREGVTRLASIGRWPTESPGFPYADRIGQWATSKGIHGVVWTALKVGFPERRGISPTLRELKTHIHGLSAVQRKLAAEYIVRTPTQITTARRPELEALLL